MTCLRKNKTEASLLGLRLRSKRLERSITLMSASVMTGVNVGQLSRFERGEFTFVSQNLQRFANYLGVNVADTADALEWALLDQRFRMARGKSDRHEAAAAALVDALEMLR